MPIYETPSAQLKGIKFRKALSQPGAYDPANEHVQGMPVSQTVQLALFTTNENAVWAAEQILKYNSYPFAQLSLTINRHAFRLQVGDPFKVSFPDYGISNMVVRVTKIEEASITEQTITVECMEEPTNLASAITEYSDPSHHRIGIVDWTVSPTQYAKVLEAPYAIVENDDIAIIPIAARESLLEMGYDLYMSIDGGSSYTYIANVRAFQPCGTLVSAYSEDTDPIDDVGFEVDFSNTDVEEDIESVSLAQSLGHTTLCVLGDELLSFKTITPHATVSDRYRLTGVIRGRYDTEPTNHEVGTGFYFIGTYYHIVRSSEIVNGATRHFKLLPYNNKYIGDLSESLPIELTITGRARTPYRPSNFRANGSGVSPKYTSDIELTWDPRVRGQGMGTGVPSAYLMGQGQTWEGYFKVKVYVSDILVRTQDNINGITWTYTEAMNTSDNGSLAEEIVFKISNWRTYLDETYESSQATLTVNKR